MPDKLYSIYQVADLLDTSPATIAEWMQGGSLPCMRLPNGPVRISSHGLGLFMKSQGMDAREILGQDEPEKGVYKPVKRSELSEYTSEADDFSPQTDDFSPPIDLSDDDAFLSSHLPSPSIIDHPQHLSQEHHQPIPPATDVDIEAIATKSILENALAQRASFIHIEPNWNNWSQPCFRIRVAGLLLDAPSLTANYPDVKAFGVIQKLKMLAGIDVDAPAPRSAQFTFVSDNRDIECYLSTYPTIKGERIVIKLTDTSREPVKLDELALVREDKLAIRRLLEKSSGLIVVAGLKLSDRTAILKAMADSLTCPEKNIITIESSPPIESAGINQVQIGYVVNNVNFTAADALNNAISQDTDAVMIDEIDDNLTASAAINLALDDTLVLAGLHAASLSAAIEGLNQLGLASGSLSKTLLAIIHPSDSETEMDIETEMATKTEIKRLCEHCRKTISSTHQVTLLENMGLNQ